MDLKTPLKEIAGIGPSLSYKLGKLNLFSVEDLLYHFPFRYDDFSQTVNVLDARIGEKVTLKGEIWSIGNIYTRSGKVLTSAIFNDGTSPIQLTWFNQSWLIKQIKSGDFLQISGKVSKYKNKLSIIAPVWEKVDQTRETEVLKHSKPMLHTGRLVPVYPETQGVTSKWLRGKIAQILPNMLEKLEDPLPDNIRGEMLPLNSAINSIHLPKSFKEAEEAKERLGFDELFYVSLATQKARMLWQKKTLIKPWKIPSNKLKEFQKNLPFKLTGSQKKVLNEILTDLKKETPMNRLLQGEVGSGKTVVAAIALYFSRLNGFKSLFMAPTEILAWQHFETISKLLKPFDISVGIYTGSRKKVKDDTDIVIGTHALLSDKLTTQNIGLVIIDEQHRFGVEQRTLLRYKGISPHFLTMTATPIPRTVALVFYADLDLSVINELPKDRPVIKTYLVPDKKRGDAYKFIEKKVKSGDQVYIITPLIEQSETQVSAKAAKVEFERLKEVFPKLTLGLLHGRLKSKEKSDVLEKFRKGSVQILVSTSVVEVGVDVPNATVILIEGAERFGLAQLHQLRGRIGRGSKESFCLLFTESIEAAERQRLKYLEKTFDGLRLAELDLKIRGSGTIFSTAQHGRIDFKIASLSNLPLIEKTKRSAEGILEDDLSLDKYPTLKAKLGDLAKEVMPD